MSVKENMSLTALRYFAACLAGCVVVVYAFGITMQSVMTGVPFTDHCSTS